MEDKNRIIRDRYAKSVVVMNFTGVYDYESFLRNPKIKWLDCRHLNGTECYCDEEGASALKRLIDGYSPQGIHFIDSGDYHYVTKFWTDKLDVPFALMVFDHHPDMQPPLFEHILSCGSWVKDVLDTNVNCRKVIVVGASDRLVQEVPEEYGSRVRFYSESSFNQEAGWKAFAAEHVSEPVYISIDKDVLNPSSAVTNWDQGSLSLPELEQLLAVVLRQEQVIGVDICGECSGCSGICLQGWLRIFGNTGRRKDGQGIYRQDNTYSEGNKEALASGYHAFSGRAVQGCVPGVVRSGSTPLSSEDREFR